MHGVELAVAPVADEQRVLIGGGELRSIAERDARGRTRANVHDRGQAIGIIRRPLARAVAPAELGTVGRHANAGGTVPGGVHVPFHVGVIREHVSALVERDVEGVAVAHRDEGPFLPLGVELVDAAAGGRHASHESVAVGHGGQQVVAFPDLGHVRAGQVGQLGAVAGDEVEALAVGGRDDGVWAVLASAVELAKLVDLVERAVAIGIAHPVEAAFVLLAPVDDDVEAVERPEQALGLADGHIDRLDLDLAGLAHGGHGHGVKLAVLVGDGEPPLGVDGHVDPGALGVLGHGVQALDSEALGHLHRGRVGGLGLIRRSGPGGCRQAQYQKQNHGPTAVELHGEILESLTWRKWAVRLSLATPGGRNRPGSSGGQGLRSHCTALRNRLHQNSASEGETTPGILAGGFRSGPNRDSLVEGPVTNTIYPEGCRCERSSPCFRACSRSAPV